MDVELRTIDRSNWRQCVELTVSPEQRSFVASNAYSLAQAAYEPEMYPYAIYRGDEMVGFIMYDFDSDLGVWEMCRLMVGEKYQRQGIGQAAVKKLLDLVTERLGHIVFYTSAVPKNTVAISFYEKSGFKLNGRIVYDEAEMEIQL